MSNQRECRKPVNDGNSWINTSSYVICKWQVHFGVIKCIRISIQSTGNPWCKRYYPLVKCKEGHWCKIMKQTTFYLIQFNHISYQPYIFSVSICQTDSISCMCILNVSQAKWLASEFRWGLAEEMNGRMLQKVLYESASCWVMHGQCECITVTDLCYSLQSSVRARYWVCLKQGSFCSLLPHRAMHFFCSAD